VGIEGSPTWVEADAAEAGALEEAIARTGPDVVFNLIGYGVDRSERDEELAAELNDGLVGRIIEAIGTRSSRWSGQSMVQVGSALEYGLASGDLDEETPPEPTTLYGRTKLAGTARVSRAARAGLRAVTARLFTVYGAGEHPGRLLPTLLAARGRTERIPLSAGQQRRDFTYVEDVAWALVALGAVSETLPPVLNLATGRLTTVRAFAEVAAGVLGIAGSRLGFGDVEVRPDEMAHQPLSVDRLRRALSWIPETTIVEGVRRTAELIGPSLAR